MPVSQRLLMLSVHYSGDRAVCFVNTCPLHIDLSIWWIAFSTLSTTGLFLLTLLVQEYFSEILLFKANFYNSA